MCIGHVGDWKVRRLDTVVPSMFAAIPSLDESEMDNFYPEHENLRVMTYRRIPHREPLPNSLIVTFLTITLIFYLVFKILFFSLTELREGLLVFAISFVIGFVTATGRYNAGV